MDGRAGAEIPVDSKQAEEANGGILYFQLAVLGKAPDALWRVFPDR